MKHGVQVRIRMGNIFFLVEKLRSSLSEALNQLVVDVNVC
jgi:hypothetical protein